MVPPVSHYWRAHSQISATFFGGAVGGPDEGGDGFEEQGQRPPEVELWMMGRGFGHVGPTLGRFAGFLGSDADETDPAAMDPKKRLLIPLFRKVIGRGQIAEDAKPRFFMRGAGIEAGDRKVLESSLNQLGLKLAGPVVVVRWGDRPAIRIAGRDDGEALRQSSARQLGAEAGVTVGWVGGLRNRRPSANGRLLCVGLVSWEKLV